MLEFSNENLPLPISDVLINKESANLQYYRNISSSTGFQLTVNATTKREVPNNVYNLLYSKLGQITFIDGKKVSFAIGGTFLHTIQIYIYSTSPELGITAMDVINNNGDSLQDNFIITKNTTPNTADVIILSAICEHTAGDIIQLRFGGGSVPAGGNLVLNILSISWTIVEL